MRSLIAKIAFAVIILCMLTLALGITRPDSPSGTFQAAPISAVDNRAAPDQSNP